MDIDERAVKEETLDDRNGGPLMGSIEERYASLEMSNIWDVRTRIHCARTIWVAVLEAQRQAGVAGITPEDVQAYRAMVDEIDTVSHFVAEKETRHETKAWIQEFNRDAGRELIHRGMTSCDITENITAWQVEQSVSLICRRLVAVMDRLLAQIRSYKDTPMVGRTHNLPAQPVLLEQRFLRCGQELHSAWSMLGLTMREYPYRGVTGAVGNHADLIGVVGDYAKARSVSSAVGHVLDAHVMWAVTAQTPPRGPDGVLAAALLAVCSGPANLALTMRLMIGQGLAAEIRPMAETGSSAMPHKTNPRYAERVEALMDVARGYAVMIQQTVGKTWNEGDVSDSATRRIAWPGLFMTVDALLSTMVVALDRFHPDLGAINREMIDHRWEMYSGRLLATAVANGRPREQAHTELKTWYAQLPQASLNDLRVILGFDEASSPEWLDLVDLVNDCVQWDSGDLGAGGEAVLQLMLERVDKYPDDAAYSPDLL